MICFEKAPPVAFEATLAGWLFLYRFFCGANCQLYSYLSNPKPLKYRQLQGFLSNSKYLLYTIYGIFCLIWHKLDTFKESEASRTGYITLTLI